MIVIGASLGGLQALQTILRGLPPTFPWPAAVVLHRDKEPDSSLCELLQRSSALPVVEVLDKQPIQPGTIYLAPADYHLLVEPGHFCLSTDDPVCCARPSIDVLFESAADVYGPSLIGVVLTGGSRDGAGGAARIQREGGIVLVQDPATAQNAVMPAAAIDATKTSFVLPLSQLGGRLIQLAQSKLPLHFPSPKSNS